MITTKNATSVSTSAEVYAAQKTSTATKTVQTEEAATQKSNSYAKEGVVLTLSGENELVKVKSKDGTVRLTGTPSTTLRWGSRGEAVRTLQENLNKLGYYTEEPDGIFGDKTVAAVMTFQKAYNLTQSGTVDTSTKAAIEKALNYHNQGILTVGSRGEAVRTLQEILTGLGYDTKGIDGIFGNNTKNAVIAFQRDNGVKADGIVGVDTRMAISYIMRDQNSGGTDGTGNVNLSLGSQGEAVATLQRNLTMLGYDTKRSDGYFDINTKNAVMEFQRAYDLDDDGIVGPDTRNALTKALDYHSRGILTKGSRGAAVETLQRNLMLLGYYKANPDGIFGVNTEKAVRLFQRVHALNPDGIVGVETHDAIKKALSSPIEASNGNLDIESWGEEVETLQRNLTQLGYYSGNVDGYFDANTENAVIAFQTVCGIKPDGVAGSATQGLIEKALAYQKNGVLGLGIRSTDVSVLQGKLSKLGYYAGKVDGSFGRLTYDAVREFQKVHGLSENGVVDAKTLEAINEALNSNGTGNTNDTILVKQSELSEGSTGEAVRTLQQNLKKLGYYTAELDGIFGSQTKSAVMAFQADQKLEVNGIAGKDTLQAIERALKELEAMQSVSKEQSSNGIPQFLGQDDLGYLSAKFEALKDCGCISPGTGDHGGKSYGLFQFAEDMGTPQSFIQWLKDKDVDIYNKLNDAYNKDGRCGENFDNAWTSISTEQTEHFSLLQYNFTKERYYDKSVKKILEDYNFDVTKRSYALNTVIWSRAVQMGNCGTVFGRAVAGMDLSTATDEDIIRALYKECSRLTSTPPHSGSYIIDAIDGDKYGITGQYLVYFSANYSNVQANVYNRLTNTELNEALKLLEQFG